MRRIMNKLRTSKEAIETIEDGATLAVGGSANRRVPMALVREIVRQEKQGLRIVSLDHTMNLGPRIEGDERVLRARLLAASMNLAFMPLDNALDFTVDRTTEACDDPFTGRAVLVASALRPDVAILHAHWADRCGNVLIDADFGFDATLARAAKRVIVSVEQIVSDETVRRYERKVVLRADEVDCVVEIPYGAHPTSCDHHYAQDAESPDETSTDHDAYLRGIGARRLFATR
jgi:glutaconate CoA-transferase, subunit A